MTKEHIDFIRNPIRYKYMYLYTQFADVLHTILAESIVSI